MKTIKFILIHIETFLMIISFVLGTGAAESHEWGWAYFLIFLPFIWGYITNFNKQIHFCEVYERAWGISIKNNK
ncbi:MAG: hypothetical protein IJH39_07290 [Clostridia bacterium]|nr:hypothetical protein [Clostridia bacterium]